MSSSLPASSGQNEHGVIICEATTPASMPDVEWCQKCCLNLIGLRERRLHAAWHLDLLGDKMNDPMCCATSDVKHTLLESAETAMRCPWCLFDMSKQSEERWFYSKGPDEIMSHMANWHLSTLPETTACPFPACNESFGRESLLDHLLMVHSVKFSARVLENTRAKWGLSADDDLRAEPVCPPLSRVLFYGRPAYHEYRRAKGDSVAQSPAQRSVDQAP